jgi:hypothetical protein
MRSNCSSRARRALSGAVRASYGLQELLGTHHDLTVLGELMTELAADLARKHRLALSAGLQSAGAALAADQQAVLLRYQQTGFDAGWWRDELKRALEPS